MKIIEMRTYSGRNIFSHKPVVKMILDLEDMAGKATAKLEGFSEQLLGLFPGLKTHYCSAGVEGGFVERLFEGTFLSHVTEHLALELQSIMGYDVHFGKTRAVEEPSIYCLVYEYMNDYCAKDFGRAAVDIVSALARNKPVSLEEILERLQRIVFESDLGPSTRAIMDEAKRRHIPVRRIGENSLLQLGYGKQLRFIEASLPDSTGCIAVESAKNKHLAKTFLQENNIPVPEGALVDTEYDAVLTAKRLGYPVVVKPYDANQGKGVTTNIDNEELLRAAYRFASGYSSRIMVEKHIQGKDYRLLVVGARVSAAAERRPPLVVGDGIHTIEELVAEENKKPRRGIGHEKPLSKIRLDSMAQALLLKSGLAADSVPEAGAVVYLRENGNISTGGSACDVTMNIHPANRALAVKAARAVGLEIAGIDIVMDDISQPLTPLNGAVIEVNAAPGLRMHLFPSQGQARNVAADILDYIYPRETPASVPIVSITGTNGKTTVTRMISHVLSLEGKTVGMTCSSGTYIGGECISKGDNTGPLSAQSVLYDREVEIAVLETARGGIVRKGLGYDLADVGLVVNISEDHLGLDGINTLKDLTFAKALVVEAVKPDGFAVLNADDLMTEYIAERVQCNLIYFSRHRNNPLIEPHIERGGMAVVLENDYVNIYWNNACTPILRVQDLPITYEGRILCNIENSLAAVSCLFALGVPDYRIRTGLESFIPDPALNAGRFNLFDMGDFRVLLDYAHNRSGYQAVVQFIQSLNAIRLVGVIGMPGDRIDMDIYQIGKISGQVFSQLYIKEDHDLRGRNPGEVASLLYYGAVNGGAQKENIEIIRPELDALETAIYRALPGDLIVMLYEKFDPALELVRKFSAHPVRTADLSSWEGPLLPLAAPELQTDSGYQEATGSKSLQ